MKTKKLISIKKYIELRFVDDDAPDPRVIRRSIKDGEILGRKIGPHYYLEVFEDLSEIDGMTGERYYG